MFIGRNRMKMIRMIVFFIYFFTYLIFSLPTLSKMKRLPTEWSNERKRQEQHQIPKHWARTLVKIAGANVKITGKSNIPKGPVLFVSNHEGNFDVPVLLGFIEKPFGFFSKIEVKKIPLVARWMEVMDCVFIDRANRRASVQALKDSVCLLEEGHSMVIFPEGTRSKGEGIGEFKKGSIRIALDAKVPIVPVAIQGTSKIMEQSKVGFQKADVTIRVLPAITTHLDAESNPNVIHHEVREQIIQALNNHHQMQSKSVS